jgi:hypothetical protein
VAINEDNWLWHPANGRVPVLTERQVELGKLGFWARLFRRKARAVPGVAVKGLHVPVLDDRQVGPVEPEWKATLEGAAKRVPGGRS